MKMRKVVPVILFGGWDSENRETWAPLIVDCPLEKLPIAASCRIRECKFAMMMIRPEQFVIGRPDGRVGGRVIKTIFYGHDALVHLQLDERFGGEDIQIRVMGTPKFKPGEYVGLRIDGDVMVYPHEGTVPVS